MVLATELSSEESYFCQARLHEIDFHPRGNVPKLDFPLEAPYSEWLISLLIREEP
jgi:hypothetical protein